MIGLPKGTRNEKVLGVSWNCKEDLFVMELSELVKRADRLHMTKRTILKVIAGLYDPLQIVNPLLVSTKTLIQELGAREVGWDEELEGDDKRPWLR